MPSVARARPVQLTGRAGGRGDGLDSAAVLFFLLFVLCVLLDFVYLVRRQDLSYASAPNHSHVSSILHVHK